MTTCPMAVGEQFRYSGPHVRLSATSWIKSSPPDVTCNSLENPSQCFFPHWPACNCTKSADDTTSSGVFKRQAIPPKIDDVVWRSMSWCNSRADGSHLGESDDRSILQSQ